MTFARALGWLWVVLTLVGFDVRAATAPENLGRLIVHEGRGTGGATLKAHLGDPAGPQSLALQGMATACIGCHAAAGGLREGNVTAPPLNATTLQGVTPPVFRAALQEGRGLDGRTLDRAMPRYRLSADELAQTLQYLQSPQHDALPALTLATLFPIDSQQLPLEHDALAGLGLCVQQFAGSMQPITLQVERYSSREEAARLWQGLAGSQHVTAMLAPSLRGWSDVFAKAFDGAAAESPVVIYPLVDDPVELPPHAPVHWLFGGAAQRRAAIASTRQRLSADGSAGQEDDWRAAPARQRQPASVTSDPPSWGRLWADNTCAALAAALRSGPFTRREDFARAWRSLDVVDSASGFQLRPGRHHSVNAWSVFQRTQQQGWRLVDPHVQLER